MKNNIKNVVMYIMAIIIVVLCNIAATMLYLTAELIKLGIKLIEAGVNKVPMVIEAVRLFSSKLIKKFTNFFNNLAAIIKTSIMTAGNAIVNDVKATKKHINFKVDSIKARHGGNAVVTIKKQGNIIDCLKTSMHEAIEFRRAIIAECR